MTLFLKPMDNWSKCDCVEWFSSLEYVETRWHQIHGKSPKQLRPSFFTFFCKQAEKLCGAELNSCCDLQPLLHLSDDVHSITKVLPVVADEFLQHFQAVTPWDLIWGSAKSFKAPRTQSQPHYLGLLMALFVIFCRTYLHVQTICLIALSSLRLREDEGISLERGQDISRGHHKKILKE